MDQIRAEVMSIISNRFIFIGATCVFLTACTPEIVLKDSMSRYQQASYQVSIGDRKQDVLAILLPTQQKLRNDYPEYVRQPERFTQEGNYIEIHYFRSGWTSDGLVTDDEMTPYVFVNDRLSSVGWSALGGPKTHGKVVPQSNTFINSTPSSQPYQVPKIGITNCNMIGNTAYCREY